LISSEKLEKPPRIDAGRFSLVGVVHRLMIEICPHCGKWIDEPVYDGIGTCQHCSRVFDSSMRNRTLSAAWACRRRHIDDASLVIDQYELDDEHARLVQSSIDRCYCHDDFLKLLGGGRLVA
jgi:hypothetical protein